MSVDVRAMSPASFERARCVLFDLDGTLIDSIALIKASFQHATAEVLGEALPDEVVLADIGMPLREQMRRIAPDRAEALVAAYRAHNIAHHDELLAEYPDVHEVVLELKGRGFALGVVTSKIGSSMHRGLERCGFEGLFDALVSADDVTVHKPAPDPVLEGARRAGVDPGRCVYVGDSPHDVAAAKAADVPSIAVLWGASSEDVLRKSGPDALIARPSQLLALLPDRPYDEGA